MPYLLKIFSGPHVGAEVALSAGETVIGSDDNCDVVLDDRLIGPRHVLVTIQEDRIECASLEGNAVLVEGKPVEKVVIRPFQYFTIGTTHLAVGPANKPWPHFDFTDFQLREPDEESAEGGETDGEDAEEDAPEPPAPPVQKRRVSTNLGTALAVGVICLNVLLLAVFLGGYGAASTTELTRASEEAELARAIQAYSPHVAIENANGQFSLTGYVNIDEELDALNRTVQQIDPAVVVRVRSTESLLTSVRQRLETDHWSPQLHAERLGPGVVRVSGTLTHDDVASRKRWQRTLDQIKADVPLKDLLVNIVETTPESTPKEVAIDAGGRMQVPPLNGSRDRILRGQPVPILDVRVSHDKIVTLSDGRQVSVGGFLPDGSRVEEIDLDHAVVRTMSGQRLFVPYGPGG